MHEARWTPVALGAPAGDLAARLRPGAAKVPPPVLAQPSDSTSPLQPPGSQAGANFELLALATSRRGAAPGFWAEEDPCGAAALTPPVAAAAVQALSVEGVLSMQVILEEGALNSAAPGAGPGRGGTGAGGH
jgi:hypothetical protein